MQNVRYRIVELMNAYFDDDNSKYYNANDVKCIIIFEYRQERKCLI